LQLCLRAHVLAMSVLKSGLLLLIVLSVATLFVTELTSLREEVSKLRGQIREHEAREVTRARDSSTSSGSVALPKVDTSQTLEAKNVAVLQALREAYHKFGPDLIRARKSILSWSQSVDLHGGTDDLDAEILYLRLRTNRAKRVAELGFGQGLMTTWLLHALQDNGADTHLFTYDVKDEHNRVVEVNGSSDLATAGTLERARGRWHFVLGDGRKTLPLHEPYDYIHSDCAHTVEFATWVTGYCRTHHPTTPTSFHDVWKPFTQQARKACPKKQMHTDSHGITPEGKVFLKHAKAVDPNRWFGIAPWHFPEFYRAVVAMREEVTGLKGVGSLLGDEEAWISNGKSPSPPRRPTTDCRVILPQVPTLFVNHFA